MQHTCRLGERENPGSSLVVCVLQPGALCDMGFVTVTLLVDVVTSEKAPTFAPDGEDCFRFFSGKYGRKPAETKKN